MSFGPTPRSTPCSPFLSLLNSFDLRNRRPTDKEEHRWFIPTILSFLPKSSHPDLLISLLTTSGSLYDFVRFQINSQFSGACLLSIFLPGSDCLRGDGPVLHPQFLFDIGVLSRGILLRVLGSEERGDGGGDGADARDILVRYFGRIFWWKRETEGEEEESEESEGESLSSPSFVELFERIETLLDQIGLFGNQLLKKRREARSRRGILEGFIVWVVDGGRGRGGRATRVNVRMQEKITQWLLTQISSGYIDLTDREFQLLKSLGGLNEHSLSLKVIEQSLHITEVHEAMGPEVVFGLCKRFFRKDNVKFLRILIGSESPLRENVFCRRKRMLGRLAMEAARRKAVECVKWILNEVVVEVGRSVRDQRELQDMEQELCVSGSQKSLDSLRKRMREREGKIRRRRKWYQRMKPALISSVFTKALRKSVLIGSYETTLAVLKVLDRVVLQRFDLSMNILELSKVFHIGLVVRCLQEGRFRLALELCRREEFVFDPDSTCKVGNVFGSLAQELLGLRTSPSQYDDDDERVHWVVFILVRIQGAASRNPQEDDANARGELVSLLRRRIPDSDLDVESFLCPEVTLRLLLVSIFASQAEPDAKELIMANRVLAMMRRDRIEAPPHLLARVMSVAGKTRKNLSRRANFPRLLCESFVPGIVVDSVAMEATEHFPLSNKDFDCLSDRLLSSSQDNLSERKAVFLWACRSPRISESRAVGLVRSLFRSDVDSLCVLLSVALPCACEKSCSDLASLLLNLMEVSSNTFLLVDLRPIIRDAFFRSLSQFCPNVVRVLCRTTCLEGVDYTEFLRETISEGVQFPLEQVQKKRDFQEIVKILAIECPGVDVAPSFAWCSSNGHDEVCDWMSEKMNMTRSLSERKSRFSFVVDHLCSSEQHIVLRRRGRGGDEQADVDVFLPSFFFSDTIPEKVPQPTVLIEVDSLSRETLLRVLFGEIDDLSIPPNVFLDLGRVFRQLKLNSHLSHVARSLIGRLRSETLLRRLLREMSSSSSAGSPHHRWSLLITGVVRSWKQLTKKKDVRSVLRRLGIPVAFGRRKNLSDLERQEKRDGFHVSFRSLFQDFVLKKLLRRFFSNSSSSISVAHSHVLALRSEFFFHGLRQIMCDTEDSEETPRITRYYEIENLDPAVVTFCVLFYHQRVLSLRDLVFPSESVALQSLLKVFAFASEIEATDIGHAAQSCFVELLLTCKASKALFLRCMEMSTTAVFGLRIRNLCARVLRLEDGFVSLVAQSHTTKYPDPAHRRCLPYEKFGIFCPVVVFDLEGITHRSRSHPNDSNSSKFVTIWVKKVAALKFYPSSGEREEFVATIAFPSLSSMPQSLIQTWRHSQQIHHLDWNLQGDSAAAVLSRLRDFVGLLDVFVKGRFFERRFLNDVGCFGNEVVEKKMRVEELAFHPIDIAKYGVPTYDEAFPNEFMHDPLKECHYFLDEMLKRLPLKSEEIPA